eukprot:4538616-Karenia_brevis.AAC.1
MDVLLQEVPPGHCALTRAMGRERGLYRMSFKSSRIAVTTDFNLDYNEGQKQATEWQAGMMQTPIPHRLLAQ